MYQSTFMGTIRDYDCFRCSNPHTTVDDINPCIALRTLDYGNNCIFMVYSFIMGNAGFGSSAVVLDIYPEIVNGIQESLHMAGFKDHFMDCRLVCTHCLQVIRGI